MDQRPGDLHRDIFDYRPLSDAQLRDYQDQGFLVLRGIVKPEGIRRLVDEAMAAWTAEKGPHDPNGTWLENALLADIHRRSRTVRD